MAPQLCFPSNRNTNPMGEGETEGSEKKKENQEEYDHLEQTPKSLEQID